VIDEGYKKLEIYQLAHRLAIDVHAMTMNLPKHELYEEGSQIRRSSKSVSALIVEGYSLRRHKNEFLLYLNRAYASAEETLEHLFKTGSLTNEVVYKQLGEGYKEVCKKIFKFIRGVGVSHSKPYSLREVETPYDDDAL
jgi:four helix bundle protein